MMLYNNSIIFIRSLVLYLLLQVHSTNAQVNIDKKLLNFLPLKMRGLEVGKSTKEFMYKKMGRPAKVQDDKHYFYNLSGINYDTTITLKGNKVFSIYHKFKLGKLFYKDLSKIFPKLGRSHLKSSKNNKDQYHLKDKNISFTVRKNSSKSVESILIGIVK